MRTIYRLQNKQPVHLLHIGKTGGTAIKYALRPFKTTEHFEIRLRPHQTRLRDIPKGHGVILFLRDPVGRFVSGFYSRQRQGLPKHFSPWSDAEKDAFETFSTANELALALSSPENTLKEKAQNAMQSIEHVRSSYKFWFGDEHYFTSRLPDIFFIGFQESLDQDFLDLSSKLGLPETAALPSDNVKAHKTPAHVDRSLSDEAVANLKSWYRADYRYIELCRELRPSINSAEPLSQSKIGDRTTKQATVKSR